MSNKRQHKTLALKDKIDILKKLDSGENMSKLATEYGVGRATIYDLRKKKEKIMKHVKMMESGPGKRKTLRVGNCPKMEDALYMWFLQERSKHTPLSGEILQAKAIEFYQKTTKKNDFLASVGWLDRFKKRYGIRLLTVSGEKQSVNKSESQHFKPKVEQVPDVKVSDSPMTTTPKITPDTAFHCFTTCITWAEENGISAKDIIILRNLQEKIFKDILKVTKNQEYFKTNELDISYSDNEGTNIIQSLYPEIAITINREKE